MFRNVWKNCHKSICVVNVYDSNGITITSFTGFKLHGLLITADSIFSINDEADQVSIKFIEEDGVSVSYNFRLGFSDFISSTITGNKSYTNNFSVLNIKDTGFKSVPSLNCYKVGYNPLHVGHPLALIGFQYDQPNLSMKTGVLSSYYHNNSQNRYMQFDGLVKRGNSGSPLIDAETCEVIGVVGYKLARTNKAYNQMLEIIRNNIDVLKTAEGKFNVGEVDPIQVLIASQNQIKQLSNEVYKFSSQGLGIALDIEHVNDHLKNLSILDKEANFINRA